MDHAALSRVSDLLSSQWGLVTGAQALSRSLTDADLRSLSDSGLLEAVHDGVYLSSREPSAAVLTMVRARWLAMFPEIPAQERLPEQGVISHATAALLLGIGEFLLDPVECTGTELRRHLPTGVKAHDGVVARADMLSLEGLPVTSAGRTIEDLVADDADGGHIGRAIRAALAHSLVTRHGLAARLNAYSGKYGLPEQDGESLLEYFQEQSYAG